MKVIDLFAGCGGFSYGFQKEGFEILGFVEVWPPAITTYLQNHPKADHLGTDIAKVRDEVISRFSGEVEIIVGGPPCQGFSIAGKRDPKDQRNQLYKEYLRFVRIIKPKYVIMENVIGLLSMKCIDNERVISKIIHDLIQLGYFVSYQVLNSFDYGVAQKRKRLILIAKKLDLFPSPQSKKKTVRDVIRNLPEDEIDLNGHLSFNMSKDTLKKIKRLDEGEKIGNFGTARQRLVYDKPSKTIVTKPIYIHPIYNRFLTPRELARIQSFPDSFEFCGSKTSMVKQIGNAVPPLMAQAIAKKIKEDMKC